MKTLLIFLLTITTAHAAGGSDGTRGGGEVVLQNGEVRLRDLVDPSVCENKTGSEVRRENAEIDNTLSKLAALDWYFAAGLKHEINNLDICFTKSLMRIRSWDWDSVIVYEPYPRIQAAIRYIYSPEVFVDRDIYSEMPAKDRAYLIIHEAIHSFISLHAPRRNESVRLAVKTIERVASGAIASPKKLHAELTRASVNYVWTAQKLKEFRTAIEFALSDLEDQQNLIRSGAAMDSLFAIDYGKIVADLSSRHTFELSRSAAARAGEVLENSGADLAILDRFVNSPVTVFDSLMVAFSTSAAAENADFQNAIVNSSAMRTGPSFLPKLVSKGLAVGEYRIVATGGYELLGIANRNSPKQLPALAVRPYTLQEKDLVPNEIAGFIQFLAIQAKRGAEGWSVIRSLATESDTFYAAFGVNELKQQLRTLRSPVERENGYLAMALPELVRGFRVVLFEEVLNKAGAEAAERLDREINWGRLGLTENLRGVK